VSTPNILVRKSEGGGGGGLLPYCKIGAKSEGYNRPGPLVREQGSDSIKGCSFPIKSCSLSLLKVPHIIKIFRKMTEMHSIIKHHTTKT
jgi:hypothetical protein